MKRDGTHTLEYVMLALFLGWVAATIFGS